MDLWLLRIKGRGSLTTKELQEEVCFEAGVMELFHRDCVGGYTTLYICQNSQNSTPKKKVDFAVCKLNDLKVKKYISPKPM